jgi:hypothetical protein
LFSTKKFHPVVTQTTLTEIAYLKPLNVAHNNQTKPNQTIDQHHTNSLSGHDRLSYQDGRFIFQILHDRFRDHHQHLSGKYSRRCNKGTLGVTTIDL